MKRLLLPLTLVGFSVISSLYLTSCKDDEDPAPIPKITFESANRSVNEDAGTIEIIVELDNPAPEDIVVEYSISGTATRKTSTNAAVADYEFVTFAGEVEIDKGDDFGTISIKIIDDNTFEEDETIILSLQDVDSDKVDFGSRVQTTITIVSDDAANTVFFETTSFSVDESVQQVDLVVKLENAATSDVTVNFELGGNAISAIRGTDEEIPEQYWDYDLGELTNSIVIPQGQTSATIPVIIYSDFNLEDPETIEVTLLSGGGVVPGTASKATINVDQEDGYIVALFWPEDPEADTDVDMDLLVWILLEDEGEPFWYPGGVALFKDFDPEFLFIPTAIEEGVFGVSAVYYAGTDDNLKFELQYVNLTDGQIEPVAERDIFSGTYTLANINKWDETENFNITQTAIMENSVLTDFDELNIPAEGSRKKALKLPANMKINKALRDKFSVRPKL